MTCPSIIYCRHYLCQRLPLSLGSNIFCSEMFGANFFFLSRHSSKGAGLARFILHQGVHEKRLWILWCDTCVFTNGRVEHSFCPEMTQKQNQWVWKENYAKRRRKGIEIWNAVKFSFFLSLCIYLQCSFFPVLSSDVLGRPRTVTQSVATWMSRAPALGFGYWTVWTCLKLE